MDLGRALGLVIAAGIGLFALVALGSLVETLFERGGTVAALAIVLAFVILGGHLGTRDQAWIANPYW